MLVHNETSLMRTETHSTATLSIPFSSLAGSLVQLVKSIHQNSSRKGTIFTKQLVERGLSGK